MAPSRTVRCQPRCDESRSARASEAWNSGRLGGFSRSSSRSAWSPAPVRRVAAPRAAAQGRSARAPVAYARVDRSATAAHTGPHADGVRPPPRLVRPDEAPSDPARHLTARARRRRPRQPEALGRPAGDRRVRGRQSRRRGEPARRALLGRARPDRRSGADAGDRPPRAPVAYDRHEARSTRSAAAWAARRHCSCSPSTRACWPAPPPSTPSPTSATSTGSSLASSAAPAAVPTSALSLGAVLQGLARTEIGGTPDDVPRAYAARSPVTYARALAESCVPLQLWWSRR